ncbi:hypothetical protein [Massilia sp. TWP1-3-3]|uniref:hypothetical protein n=1 Tax=Massilia sp. TWP1-3-3 TaxID=2804573 RepID=UPI003CF9D941
MNPNINPVIAVSEVRRERYMPVDGLLRLLGSDKEIERAIDSYLRYAVSVLPPHRPNGKTLHLHQAATSICKVASARPTATTLFVSLPELSSDS